MPPIVFLEWNLTFHFFIPELGLCYWPKVDTDPSAEGEAANLRWLDCEVHYDNLFGEDDVKPTLNECTERVREKLATS